MQGVGFRSFVLHAARGLGVDGDVRNLGDGRVEVRAAAEAAALDALRRAVELGPPGARVTSVVEDPWVPPGRPAGFHVRY